MERVLRRPAMAPSASLVGPNAATATATVAGSSSVTPRVTSEAIEMEALPPPRVGEKFQCTDVPRRVEESEWPLKRTQTIPSIRVKLAEGIDTEKEPFAKLFSERMTKHSGACRGR